MAVATVWEGVDPIADDRVPRDAPFEADDVVLPVSSLWIEALLLLDHDGAQGRSRRVLLFQFLLHDHAAGGEMGRLRLLHRLFAGLVDVDVEPELPVWVGWSEGRRGAKERRLIRKAQGLFVDALP